VRKEGRVGGVGSTYFAIVAVDACIHAYTHVLMYYSLLFLLVSFFIPSSAHSKVDFGSADPGLFDKMFSTFKILKQSPAYTAAMSDSSIDMTDLATVRWLVMVVGGGEWRSSTSASADGIGWVALHAYMYSAY